ncbi:oligosaccharide flippase family protein [candidate division KSB1 bacterium]|nr:oligosaccharide flippase family protein [candidate division KSB1 bacterium]
MTLLRIFSTSFLAEGVVTFVGFVNSIIITRALGVEGRGQYSLTMTIVSVLSLVFGDGLARANTYLTSRDAKNTKALFGNSMIFTVITAIFLLFLGLSGYPLISIAFPGLSFSLVLVAFIVVPLLISERGMIAIFLGKQDYNRYNFFLAFPFVLYLAANLVTLFVTNVTPFKVMFNYTLAIGLAFGFIFYIFIKQEKGIYPDQVIARQSWNAGSKAMVSHISLFLLFRIDIILINLFLGVGAAGLYSIAVLLAELLQKLANTAGNVIFPKISADNNEKHRALTNKVMFFVMVISALFSLFVIFLGKNIIILLFKKDFAASATALYWLLPGAVMMSGAKILNFALWGRGFPRVTVIAPLVALIFNIVLNILLIPRLGINGSSIATSCSFIIYSIILATHYFGTGGRIIAK